jgi:hypothetical protein
MDVKKFLDFRLLCLIGSLFIIIAMFLPWISFASLFDLFILNTAIQNENFFLFLFPLISGIICFIGGIFLIYNDEYKLNSIIINFIGLGFLLFFFFDYIPREIDFLARAGIGFYLSIVGFLFIILYIINIVYMREKEQQNKEGNK